MHKSIFAVALASSVALAGCASTPQNGDIAQGAAIGAAVAVLASALLRRD